MYVQSRMISYFTCLTLISLSFVPFRLTEPVLSAEPMPLRSSAILSDLISTPQSATLFWIHQPISELLSYVSARTFCHITGTSAPYSFTLQSPGTLNSNSHLGSATFYWLILTCWTSKAFSFGLLRPYYSAFCSWWLLTMNGLWNTHTASCAGGHI